MANLVSLLPRKIRETPAWRIFFEKVDDLFSKEIRSPAKQILDLRNPREIETTFIPLLQNLLGCDTKLDYFPEHIQRAIIEALYEYYARCGTKSLERFLALCTEYITQISPLWTTDYKVFYDKPLGTTIYEDPTNGKWFITPHYAVFVDGLLSYIQTQSINTSALLGHQYCQLGKIALSYPNRGFANFRDKYDVTLVEDLFYEFAPVHLVFDRIIRSYILESDLYLVGAMKMTVVSPASLAITG